MRQSRRRLVLAHTPTEAAEMLKIWDDVALSFGLETSTDKTKVMYSFRPDDAPVPQPIQLSTASPATYPTELTMTGSSTSTACAR